MVRKIKEPVEKRALQPKTGWDTKAAIEALLANSDEAPAAPVRQLNRQEIRAAAEGVFQWRHYERDPIRSAAHIGSLARDLRTTGKPFEPLLVFPAGDRYYVIDGHHRLAAYEAADWNAPVPVQIFEGSVEDARMAALNGNSKDKLPMTRAEKFDAAWQLVKEERLSKQQIVDTGTASRGTIRTMREKWGQIKEADDEQLRSMTWAQALRWTPAGEPPSGDEDWQEQKVQELVKRLVETGLATEFGKYPDMAMEAFSRINRDLPKKLVAEADPDAIDWARSQYHEDPIELNADDMHQF